MDLEELKKAYGAASEKYGTPGFKELNECFEIDRIERDTDCIVREVRKTMMDKIVGYIRFIEMVLNPAQAPPMFLSFVKQVGDEDKKSIQEVYKAFVELELKALRLEINYSEKNEAGVIDEIYRVWNAHKENLNEMIDMMDKNWNSSGTKKEKGYFG